MPRLLDLFCKAGGAGMGYYQAGFEVVGVDIEPQPHYPFEFIQADALTFDLSDYDVIHASPPCQGYSVLNHVNKREYPMLIPQMRARLQASGKPWIMENVKGAPMQYYVQLCGSHFGLPIRRHRQFETSHLIFAPGPCRHKGQGIAIHGGHIRIVKIYGHPGPRYENFTLEEGRKAMGISWMNTKELCQAIPPAYTKWIGDSYMHFALY